MNRERPLLEVEGLETRFFTDEGVIKAVDGVDFSIRRGETFCLVGESGCGKSVTAFSIMRIVSKPGRVIAGSIRLRRNGEQVVDLAAMHPRGASMREIRGKDIGMVFQEPMTSLSPVHTIGDQVTEAIRLHMGLSRSEARQEALLALQSVGFPKPERHFDYYPFQLSGGMRQRAMIAGALICHPSLLIADEPTTALDVTTEAVILDLIKELQQEMGMAVMYITHDLGVVAETADTVAVMYLGRIVEKADVYSLFASPQHPYTEALLHSIPRIGASKQERLATIRGMVPHPFNRPQGCTFHPRCVYYMPGICDRMPPPVVELEPGHTVRCFRYGDADGRQREGDVA